MLRRLRGKQRRDPVIPWRSVPQIHIAVRPGTRHLEFRVSLAKEYEENDSAGAQSSLSKVDTLVMNCSHRYAAH